MWEHILIIIIVAIAALYVIRGLRASATGKTGCHDDHCAGCPHGGGCQHREGETCPSEYSLDRTEPRQP